MASRRSAGDEFVELLESFRQVGSTGQAGLTGVRDATKAMRTLVSADVSLARSAFGRTLALTGVAIAFGASAWLLLMATLVVWLNRGLGMSFSLSLLLTALLSVAGTALATWAATRYFDHTRLKATRRQLAQLGVGELAAMMPGAGSGVRTEDAADAVANATEGTPIKKGLGIDVTPP